jgi:hypothetical protein
MNGVVAVGFIRAHSILALVTRSLSVLLPNLSDLLTKQPYDAIRPRPRRDLVALLYRSAHVV